MKKQNAKDMTSYNIFKFKIIETQIPPSTARSIVITMVKLFTVLYWVDVEKRTYKKIAL